MAASLISLAAVAAVVAGNHIPLRTMEYFLLDTLFQLTCTLYKYVNGIRDYSSLLWCDYIVSSGGKYLDKLTSSVACRSTRRKRNAGEAVLVIAAGNGGIAAMSWVSGLGDVRGRQASEPVAPAPSLPSVVGR